jgi:hypothetical protein
MPDVEASEFHMPALVSEQNPIQYCVPFVTASAGEKVNVLTPVTGLLIAAVAVANKVVGAPTLLENIAHLRLPVYPVLRLQTILPTVPVYVAV